MKIVDMYYGEGRVDKMIGEFANRKIDAIIHKASDLYVLPDESGKYRWVNPIHNNWDRHNHIDPLFAHNFDIAREYGIIVGAYAFIRFDRPKYESKSNVVLRNLAYYKQAVDGRITHYDRPFLDFEQEQSQIEAHNLKPMDVALMSRDIILMFEDAYHLPPMIYTFAEWAEYYLFRSPELVDFFTKYPLWIASPVPTDKNTLKRIYPWSQPKLPKYQKEFVWDWTLWQYTWGGLFANTSLDVNETRDKINLAEFIAPNQVPMTQFPLRKYGKNTRIKIV